MKIKFDLNGTTRKKLVQSIVEITGQQSVYQYTPTYAYKIGEFTVDRDGAVIGDDEQVLERLVHNLIGDGYKPDTAADTEDGKLSEQAAESEQSADVGLTVGIPLNCVNVENLKNLLTAKGDLIRKALGIENLSFSVDEDKVEFPWFGEVDSDTVQAYTHFIAALCEMSVSQKRISAKTKEVDNEKYAFRCFLLRLGFIGEKYKQERKILLKNLSGSAAFKDTVTVICYGEKEVWNSRKAAADYYLQAISGSDGSECERYTKIYTQILSGEKVCTDEVE